MKLVGFLYSIALGFVVWSISFSIITFIPTPPELYVFPGIMVGLINGFLIIIVMNYYVKKFKVKNWFRDTLIAGILIATLSLVLDYMFVAKFSESLIVLMGYPLYIAFSIFGGYLNKRK